MELRSARKQGAFMPQNVFSRVWKRPHEYEAYIWLLRYFDNNENTLLIDIGGNSGYWAETFREFFPESSVLAFEPVNDMFREYQNRFKDMLGSKVFVENVALSNQSGELEINVAKNYGLTSFLRYDTALSDRNKEFTSTQKVRVQQLNNYADKIGSDTVIKIVKIDVQGFELNVLKGAEQVLHNFDAFVIECSFLSEFEGEKPTFAALTSLLLNFGFYPVLFGVYDVNRSIVGWERDVLFIKEKYLTKSWK